MLKNRNKASYVNGGERRKRRTAGFTMAEMLIVIAIIGVLAAVSFIAVQAHQKSMTQLQYDAIAKEIFVAAQNHLTLAKSENYQDTAALTHNRGTAGDANADKTSKEGEPVAYNKDIYYFTKSGFTTDGSSILDQMLPFGSVELVTGGNFIIRYQPNTARVLDVFYWTDEAKYGITNVDYVTAVDNYRDTPEVSKKDARSKYESGSGVLGWCGGEDIVESGEYLEAPEIKVINKEMLLVNVIDPNTGKTTLSPKLKLIVTGMQSGAKIAIPLTNAGTGRIVPAPNGKEYNVVLDDITTKEMHFSELKTKPPVDSQTNNKDFIAGENITIQAVAYSNDVLTSVAYSGEWTTNSLFEEVTEDVVVAGNVTTKTAKQVKISNIRHLENLNDNLSSVEYSRTYFNSSINAVQTVELDWDAFKTALNALRKERIDSSATETDPINIYDKNNKKTKDNCFLPVSSSYTLSYDGQSQIKKSEITGEGQAAVTTEKTIKDNHSIKGIKVDNVDATGNDYAEILNGGVFGSLTGGEIKNLELIDTKVSLASGNAGALAGTLSGTTITNVVAHNMSDFETELTKTDKTKTTVFTKASGAAGGLIGSATGCTIKKSASALIVKSEGGNAGGLIGTAVGGTVSGCYAGGHAIDKMNGTGTDAEVIGVTYDSDKYNVTASGVAGGLIGDAGAAVISYSYSTCSATGATVGGLIGTGSGKIQHSYCTGKVSGTKQGAFAGDWKYTSQTDTDDNWYFEIINEFSDATLGYDCLTPVPKEGESDGTKKGVKALDVNAEEYNKFCGASTDWKSAVPYKVQTKLEDYYGGKYNLKTVAQLDTSTPKQVDVIETATTVNNVTTPADFVATHYGDWPAPEIFVVNTKTE